MGWQKVPLIKPKPFRHVSLVKLPKNWCVFDLFDWNQNIIVEVGCGNGEWLLSQARQNKNFFYIGIERTLNKSLALLNSSSLSGLPNLISLRADAVALIPEKFPPESVSEFYFFYPNPYPKKKQASQRFFVSSSFEVFHKALKTGGKIYLAGNIKDYVEEASIFLEKFWGYQTGF